MLLITLILAVVAVWFLNVKLDFEDDNYRVIIGMAEKIIEKI